MLVLFSFSVTLLIVIILLQLPLNFYSEALPFLPSIDSSVGIATDYRIDDYVSVPGRDKRFFSTS
jgi:hypothetical protein